MSLPYLLTFPCDKQDKFTAITTPNSKTYELTVLALELKDALYTC